MGLAAARHTLQLGWAYRQAADLGNAHLGSTYSDTNAPGRLEHPRSAAGARRVEARRRRRRRRSVAAVAAAQCHGKGAGCSAGGGESLFAWPERSATHLAAVPLARACGDAPNEAHEQFSVWEASKQAKASKRWVRESPPPRSAASPPVPPKLIVRSLGGAQSATRATVGLGTNAAGRLAKAY